jgi:hypothetical protein
MASNNNQNIIPKDCSYQCGTRIYWNTSENSYFEVFTQKRHICKNRPNNNNNVSKPSTYIPKPNYYKKPWSNTPKPKMSNSIELLSGPIDTVKKQYELLSDIVSEYQGKVHGSQSHIVGANNSIQLIVYYEVPLGQRDEVKRKFDSLVRSQMAIQRNNY